MADRTHAQRRLDERYRIEANDNDLDGMRAQVMRKNGAMLSRLHNDRELWAIQWKGRRLFPVYDRRIDVIVTFMPEKFRLPGKGASF